MNKLYVCLPLLTVAGAAVAQSSVTLFGVVDARVAIGRGSIADVRQLASGGANTSRIGVRGVEDLGDGLSASFWMEAGLNVDSGIGAATNVNNRTAGATTAGGLVFNRRATLSLAGQWGELRAGRDYMPQYWNLYYADPFGTSASACRCPRPTRRRCLAWARGGDGAECLVQRPRSGAPSFP